MPRLGPRLGLALAATLTSTTLSLPHAAVAWPGDRPAHHHGSAPKPPEPVRTTVPTVEARATLSADFLAAGPPSGAQATPAHGRTGPFAGQVVPGFSAVVEDPDGTFWAQPDNGFGAKTNSADFLLRIYRIAPQWETAEGGPGRIDVRGFISLRDPERRIPFPIVNDDTSDRLLTGADFDVESLVRQPDGTFWIGEEFGPFLLHVDATGTVLSAPVPFVDGASPQSPVQGPDAAPQRIGASKGFEAMAGSADGRYLYPALEGAFLDDADQRRHWIYEFDTRAGRYTGRRWAYQTDDAANLVADSFSVRGGRMLVLERDNHDGATAVTKRIYSVDLRRTERDGFLAKELVVDLLKIANPAGIGTRTSPGAYGVGDPFSFPFVSVETVVQLRDGRLLTANDNNYPGDDARVPGTPDDTELAVIDLEKARVTPNARTLIGHRGSSGTRPEHTLASYEQAIQACADYIEPDLVPTKDGVLVARHENEIGGTTDVSTRAEFADRRTTKTIDGRAVTGWFTEDFTLAELKTLRAKERLPLVRPGNTAFDGRYAVPTFDEVLDLARHSRTCTGAPVGVYPETKHPTYFDSIGLSPEEPLVATLAANGYDERDPVRLQSFETTNLRQLDRRTDFRLVQLMDCSGAPYDLVAQGDPTTYADLASRRGLRAIGRYADGIGPCKDLVIPRDAAGRLLRPTDVVRDAHRADLVVHPFTFRKENQFLPLEFRRGTDPNATGDLAGELRAFLAAGVDGFFTDDPALGRDVLD